MGISATLILTHAHMDHVRYAKEFFQSGSRPKDVEFANGYRKDKYVHAYSTNSGTAYVDCGDKPPKYIKGKVLGHKQGGFPDARFDPHLAVSRIFATKTTKKWLVVESNNSDYFEAPNPSDIVGLDYYDNYKAKEIGADLTFYPSNHAFGAANVRIKGEKTIYHMSDAGYGEYAAYARDLGYNTPSRYAKETEQHPLLNREHKSVAKGLLDADYICLDTSHIYSDYEADKKAINAYNEKLDELKEGKLPYMMLSFHSPLNIFNYLFDAQKRFETRDDRRAVTLVFTSIQMKRLFESFVLRGQFQRHLTNDPLVEEALRKLGDFQSAYCDPYNIKNYRFQPKSLILTSRANAEKKLQRYRFLEDRMFKVYCKYVGFKIDRNSISFVVKHHPDQTELFTLLAALIEEGKEGQTFILNSAHDFVIKELKKNLGAFDGIRNFAKDKGKNLLGVTRESGVIDMTKTPLGLKHLPLSV